MSNMTVNSTPSSSNTSANAGSSAVSTVTGGGSLNEQDFLNLLTTELTNQDPTNPQDDTQFIAELAQFSSLEGINNLQSTSQQEQGVSLLGKTVSAIVDQNNVQSSITGTVTGVTYNSNGVSLTVNTGSGANSSGTTTTVNLTDVQSIQ